MVYELDTLPAQREHELEVFCQVFLSENPHPESFGH